MYVSSVLGTTQRLGVFRSLSLEVRSPSEFFTLFIGDTSGDKGGFFSGGSCLGGLLQGFLRHVNVIVCFDEIAST